MQTKTKHIKQRRNIILILIYFSLKEYSHFAAKSNISGSKFTFCYYGLKLKSDVTFSTVNEKKEYNFSLVSHLTPIHV